MLKRFAILLFFLTACLGSVMAERALYVVTARTLNVRTGPGSHYYAYGTFSRGDTILVKGHTNGWAAVQDGNQTGYVSLRYIRYLYSLPDQKPQKAKRQSDAWDKPYQVVKVILWILAAVIIVGGLFGAEILGGIAMIIQIVCGTGAFIGWIGWDNGRAGAVISMGVMAGIILLIILLFFKSSSDYHNSLFGRFTQLLWTLLSLPFFLLNLLQFWLSKPWRPFMKRNTLPDKSKPAMRTFLRIMQIPFYIALFPLRLVNAVYYNILIYNGYALLNYFIEVVKPSDWSEGDKDFGSWVVHLPKRLVKYLLWHGSLTLIESIIWTIIDTFFPAVTLYHGTATEYADNMLCDPHRNGDREMKKGWLSGIWNVGGGNYAGDGIYFGIFRKTLRNYEQGCAIACRVTMGKTIDTVLMPDNVYNAAGRPNASAVSNWGLNNGYVCGEWWREDRGTDWWEICMYDRQNRYNESWRIRPIYAIHSQSGIMLRIPGGPAHWLFREQVVSDMMDSMKIDVN